MSSQRVAQYLYGIVGALQPLALPAAGVHGAEEAWRLISEGTLAAVASDTEADTYAFSRSTAMAHQAVVQEVMRQATILPFRFGTMAPGEEEVRDLLREHQEHLLGQLRYLEGKAEYGLKALWRDREQPYREVLMQRDDIRSLRDALVSQGREPRQDERLRVGEMVYAALEAKRAEETRRILDRLGPLAAAVRESPILLDQMILNAAFLLPRGAELAFEGSLRALDHEYRDRVRFRLVGPAAPFSFVQMPGS